VTVRAADAVESVRQWIASGVKGTSHQGFPVVDGAGYLVGVVTRRDLLDAAVPGERTVKELIRRPPKVVYDDNTLRDAADHMVNHDIGRLPVMSRAEPSKLVGIVTRGDVLRAHRRRLDETQRTQRSIDLKTLGGRWRGRAERIET
jgi:predicted transcriptional regulator